MKSQGGNCISRAKASVFILENKRSHVIPQFCKLQELMPCILFLLNSYLELARITGKDWERGIEVPDLLLDSPRFCLVLLYY